MPTNTPLPVQDVSLDDTIKLLRGELALTFPGVKFSIRRSRGTAYGWVHVYWTDGPTGAEVGRITASYEGEKFNPWDDSVNLVEHLSARGDGQVVRVRYGTRGINYHRDISDTVRMDTLRRVIHHMAIDNVSREQAEAWLALPDADLATESRFARIGSLWLPDVVDRALSTPGDFGFLYPERAGA